MFQVDDCRRNGAATILAMSVSHMIEHPSPGTRPPASSFTSEPAAGKRPPSPAWERRPWRRAAPEGRLAALAAESAKARGQLLSVRSAQGASSSPGARQRLGALEQKLHQIHLTAGRLALALPPTGAESEVHAIRAEIADAESERDRLRGEGHRLIEETWTRVRSWIVPRAPALIAMVLGWFIARSYAMSHTGAIMSSVGLSPTRRGPHLVSLTGDTLLVQYGLALVVAALAAYAAHRVAGRVRTAVETVRERSSQATRAAGVARNPE
jgi:hypothetical protein